MKNEILTHERKSILAGNFPVLDKVVKVVTPVKEGDIVGVSATNTYGKFDKSTYTEVYGIAYTAAEGSSECGILITGEIAEEFVLLPVGEEEATKNLLKKISLFVK